MSVDLSRFIALVILGLFFYAMWGGAEPKFRNFMGGVAIIGILLGYVYLLGFFICDLMGWGNNWFSYR